MLEDANYRRKVAKEIFEVLSESAELIKDDPAFFEVYVPVKITLKVIPIHWIGSTCLELLARM